MSGWFTPTSTNDPSTAWIDDDNIRDDDLNSLASVFADQVWIEALYSTPVENADRIRISADRLKTAPLLKSNLVVDIELRYDDVWNAFQTNHTLINRAVQTWNDLEIGSRKTIQGVRLRTNDAGIGVGYLGRIYEVDVGCLPVQTNILDPADGAGGVVLHSSLGAETIFEVDEAYWYIGVQGQGWDVENGVAHGSGGTLFWYDIVPLVWESYTVYVWRLDVENEIGLVQGTEWTFTTVPAPAWYYRELATKGT